MAAFVTEFDIPFPTVVDELTGLWGDFGVFGRGQWVLVDDSGDLTLIPYDLYEPELSQQVEQLIAA
jgi:hypothetical protein